MADGMGIDIQADVHTRQDPGVQGNADEGPHKKPGTGSGARQRKQTAKGREYHKSMKSDNFNSALARLKRHIRSATGMTEDPTDVDTLKKQRYQLSIDMNGFDGAFHEFKPLLEEDEEDVTATYEEAQAEAHQTLVNLKTVIDIMEEEAEESRSRASSHSKASSHRSRTSATRADMAAEAAAAAMELKYLEEEAQRKAELQKLQARKKMDVAKAKLDAFIKYDEEDGSYIHVPKATEDKETLVKNYISDLQRPSSPTQERMNASNRLRAEAEEFRPSHVMSVKEKAKEIKEMDLTRTTETLINQLMLSRLPAPEPSVFTGDPMKFPSWKASFITLIESRGISTMEAIHYLKKYIGGAALEAVEGFFFINDERAYDEAMYLLEERFGNPFQVANSFRDRLESWPKVSNHDGQGLRRLSDFLRQCEAAMSMVGSLSVLNDEREIRKLLIKLPDWFVSRWGRRSRDWKDMHDLPPPFSVFAEFLRKEAEYACDPITSVQALRELEKKTSHTNPRASQRPRGSHAGVAQETEKSKVSQPSGKDKQINPEKCAYCQDKSHKIGYCRKFSALTWEDRSSFVKKKGLCYGCLKFGHMKSKCQRKLSCKICEKGHPTVLHKETEKPVPTDNPLEDKKSSGTSNGPINAGSHMSCDGRGCTFAIVPVKVRMFGQLTETETYAFLDPGSNVTFCTDDLLRRIGGHGSRRFKMTVDTMGVPHNLTTQVVKGLEICDLSGQHSVRIPEAYTKESIPATAKHIPRNEDIERWQHLRGIDLPQVDAPIEILIGNNIPDAYIPLDTKTGPSDSPFATKTRLGWVIWSLLRDSEVGEMMSCRAELLSLEKIDDTRKLEQLVQKGFNLDFPERRIDDRNEPSKEDKLFMDKVRGSMVLEDGHYKIGLPFREDEVVLPDNRNQAEQRLNGLRKKMTRNSQFHSDYTEFMEKMIHKQYAEAVPEEELERCDGRVWYIPHHGVYHPRKPEKIRVVFDCSAVHMGTSLNSILLQGPNLTNSLLEVLLNFREERIAMMADIEAMFYQVRVPLDDRDCLRFLWWPGGDVSLEPVMYRMKVHLFGAVSSPSCANMALKQTIQDNKDLYDHQVCEAIDQNFYVDDFLKSMEECTQALGLAKDVVELCDKGGFRLTKWISNDREMIASIAPEVRATRFQELDIESDDLPQDRALGVSWRVETDNFGFRVQSPALVPNTRRSILSVVSSLFDPVGFVTPFVLKAKSLLQTLCRQGLSWDEEVPIEILREWENWLQELKLLDTFTISRCIKPVGFGEIRSAQIHHFSDASESGYGVVTYLRLVNREDRVHCMLLLSRARVNPLKKITVPRLELTAATVAVRLHEKLVKQLKYACPDIYYWTDSMAVLRFIRNTTSRFHTFVANRISEIQEATTSDQWRYVPSQENPADVVSRGLSANQLLKSKTWTRGPDFLWKEESEWPKQPDIGPMSPDEPEVKRSKPGINLGIISAKTDLMDRLLTHFSDWHKLKKAVALLLIVKQRLMSWVSKRKLLEEELRERFPDNIERAIVVEDLMRKEKLLKKDTKFPTIDVALLNEAEICILIYQQKKSFQSELNGKISKQSSVYRLNPVMKDGLLRVGGRLETSRLSYGAKHPIILPAKCHVSELILRDIHQSIGHLSKDAMLAQLRQRYWIIGASTTVKRLVKSCVICRKYQARAMGQKMADLPLDRTVSDEPPFTRTGVDFFGPFEVKRGRSTVKRYGVIFTCFSLRAIHLEMAFSLDTSSCIDALRRFVSRRGPVKIMWSDNGTNLVGAERELREEMQNWDKEHIREQLLQKGIEWNFNPPGASHFGGVWERMIRTVRKVLYSLLQRCPRNLDDEGLMTLFCEVEAIVNDRPITRVSSESSDAEALTPSQLLLLKPGPQYPGGLFSKEDVYSRRRWKQVQYLADSFWERWSKEYLVLLQERQKWFNPKKNIAVGDIVLIVDSAPRSSWALGRVVEVEQDQHGLVRIAHVKTQTNVLRRPIHKLCMILEADNL
jgi:transposase InsO family protein